MSREAMSSDRVECFHPSCHCSFKSEASMLQHFTDRHIRPQNNLACPLCNCFFVTKDSLEDHLRSPAHQLNPTEALAEAAAAAADNDNLAPPADEDQQWIEGGVACNDCGRLFKRTDFLHEHQWASSKHTHVANKRAPNRGSCVRACSQCGKKFGSADHLEDHFMDQHPISEVPESSEERTWEEVAGRFIAKRTNPTIKLYKVHRIFKVYNTGRRRKDFEEYRKELKNEMASKRIDMNEDEVQLDVLQNGNQRVLYHGTTVKCQLGRPVSDVGAHTSSLCQSTDCSLCRILQVGFKKNKCKKDKFQRFGIGIYTSSVSSKASAYVKCSSSDVKENYKVMIVCKVLVGRPHHCTRNAKQLEGPPMGFHSVQGDPGVDLDYDELVVYDDRAILPAFIILYSSSDCMAISAGVFVRLYGFVRSLPPYVLYFLIALFFSFVLEEFCPSYRESYKECSKAYTECSKFRDLKISPYMECLKAYTKCLHAQNGFQSPFWESK